MSDQNNAPNNVIQFPGRRKEEEKPKEQAQPTPAGSQKPAPAAKAAVAKRRKTKVAGSVLAIALATIAVNKYTFEHRVETLDASSISSTDVSRTIASVEQVSWQRDAAWEKQLAESLASARVRQVASATIGHAPTAEEKLRWQTLGENYTYVFRQDVHSIAEIEFQDSTSNPAYVLDRKSFLKDYGQLLDKSFASAELKSVEVSHDKTVESYTLFDKDKHAKSEARFELDNHKRLLSLKVEPTQI